MVKVPAYYKSFSSLPGLQQPKNLCYTLISEQREGRTCYGIRITEVGPGGMDCREAEPFTACRNRAEMLLTYLYEHAVTADQCAPVVQDVCAQMNWEVYHGTCANPAAYCG